MIAPLATVYLPLPLLPHQHSTALVIYHCIANHPIIQGLKITHFLRIDWVYLGGSYLGFLMRLQSDVVGASVT